MREGDIQTDRESERVADRDFQSNRLRITEAMSAGSIIAALFKVICIIPHFSLARQQLRHRQQRAPPTPPLKMSLVPVTETHSSTK